MSKNAVFGLNSLTGFWSRQYRRKCRFSLVLDPSGEVQKSIKANWPIWTPYYRSVFSPLLVRLGTLSLSNQGYLDPASRRVYRAQPIDSYSEKKSGVILDCDCREFSYHYKDQEVVLCACEYLRDLDVVKIRQSNSV